MPWEILFLVKLDDGSAEQPAHLQSVLRPRCSLQMEDRISFGLAQPLFTNLLLSDSLEKIDSINVKPDFTTPPLQDTARPRTGPGSQTAPDQWPGSTAVWCTTPGFWQCAGESDASNAISCQPAERGWEKKKKKKKVNIRLTTQKNSVYPFQNQSDKTPRTEFFSVLQNSLTIA